MRALRLVPAFGIVMLGAALLLPAGTAAPPAAARAAPEAQQGQQPIRVQVGLVNLYVTVRDNHKRILPDLTKDEFRVEENGEPQQIAFFSRETSLPLTLGLLIDTSGSEEQMLGAEQDAASQFLGRVMRKGDEAMVISFDLDVDLLSDFSSDPGHLDRAIRRARINAPSTPPMIQGPFPQVNSGGTNFYDAVYLACHDKLASEAGRKALVILTDAADTGSKLRLEDALEAAQRTDTVIHILFISDPHFRSDYGAAKKLAEETGGRVIEVRSEKKLNEAFQQISEELRSQYVLGYYPTNAARDGSFRKIKVESMRKDTKVLARRGYYAPRD